MESTFGPILVAVVGLCLNFGLPLGLPPQPLNAVIERAAPDDCLAYLSWAGIATPDPNSENQTELLLAEPEVRKFLQAVDSQLAGILMRDGSGPEQQMVNEEVPRLIKTLLTHPAAIFIEKFAVENDGPPNISGGIAVNAGDDRDALEASLTRLIALIPALPGAADGSAVEMIAGAKCRQMPLPPGGPEIWWGFKGKYLILGIGKQALVGLVARMSDTNRIAPPWLADTREKLKVDRVSQTSYINVQGIARALGKPQLDATTFPIWKAAGIESIQSVSAVSGLNRGGMLSRALIDCGGNPTGILGMLGDKPLTPEDFKAASIDSTAAVVLRVSLTQVYDSLLKIAETPDPATNQMMEQGIAGIQAAIGISLRDDLLGSLGDTICVYGPAANDGNPLGGIATISIRDHDRFTKAERAIVDFFKKGPLAAPGAPTLKEDASGDNTINSLQIAGAPVTPTWTIAKDEFIFGLAPQAVTDYLSRPAPAKSLANVASIAGVLRRPVGPSLVTYMDLNGAIGNMHGLAQSALPLANAQLTLMGVPFTVPELPPLEAIASHLRPSITLVTRTSAGIMIERVQTVPVVTDAITVGPLAVAVVLPAVQAARAAAQRTEAMNNLKQIGLALHNDHAVRRAFPGAAIMSKDGKPLLSWRVRILPYIEEKVLYDQFHLDEPWDSEHNLKLIESMPLPYKMPGVELEPGKTNYLAITGKNAMFPLDKGRNIESVTDGLSNTLMVVEANPQKAVIWTKPDDLPADEKTLDALSGARPGGFNALFGDGSVRFISDSIDPKVFQAMLTVDGGEAVDREALDK